MSELVSKGVDLVIYGMGTVFIFLTLLVFATQFMSWLIQKGAPVSTGTGSADGEDPALLAAVAAAVRAFRSRHKN